MVEFFLYFNCVATAASVMVNGQKGIDAFSLSLCDWYSGNDNILSVCLSHSSHACQTTALHSYRNINDPNEMEMSCLSALGCKYGYVYTRLARCKL